MAEKLFYSMGEVSEMFDVNPSLLRYWESEFGELNPKRNKKGNRMYTSDDIKTLKLIYHLVKERGMTLDGANKVIKQNRKGVEGVEKDVQLLEQLQKIKSLLFEVREELKTDDDLDQTTAVLTPSERLGSKNDDEDIDYEEMDIIMDGTIVKVRRNRNNRDAEDKELFAFYEQSLF